MLLSIDWDLAIPWIVVAVVVYLAVVVIGSMIISRSIVGRAFEGSRWAGLITTLRSDSQKPAVKSHPEDSVVFNQLADNIREQELRPLVENYDDNGERRSSARSYQPLNRGYALFLWALMWLEVLVFAVIAILVFTNDKTDKTAPVAVVVTSPTAVAVATQVGEADNSPKATNLVGECLSSHVSGMIDIPGGTADLPFTVFTEWQDQAGGWHWVEGAGKEINTTGQVNFEMNVSATPHETKVLRVRFKDKDWVYGKKISATFPPCS